MQYVSGVLLKEMPGIAEFKRLQESSVGDKFVVNAAICLTYLDETDGKILFLSSEKTVQKLENLIPDFLDGSLALRILQ